MDNNYTNNNYGNGYSGNSGENKDNANNNQSYYYSAEYNSPNGTSQRTSQQTAGTGQNAYSNQSAYTDQSAYTNQNAYANQSANMNQNAYAGQNAYSGQNAYGGQGGAAYNPYQQPTGAGKRPKRQKQPRQKKTGFGVMLGKCAAIAVVFGLVAGGVFTGVSYAGTHLLGITNTQEVGKSKENNANNNDNNGAVKQTASGTAEDLTDLSAMVEEVMPSIVAITNTGTVTYQTFWGAQEYESQSAGSGVIIRQDDKYLYIVTNNHVVNGADSLTVQFADNTTVSCEVKGTDPADDLAVVRVELKSIEQETLDAIKVATVGESESLQVGNAVIAIGNALGYGQSMTGGYISALGRTVTVQDQSTGETTVYNNMIQTDASINPGNSGGALLNASGELIGINSVKYADTNVEGFGYAIPISDAMPIIDQLITREKVDESQSAYLGIQGQDISADVSEAYNMPEGIYLYQVLPKSAAERAGLRQGDIITKFDGQSVSAMSELKELMTYYKAGQKVTITIQRLSQGYEEQEIEVTLGSARDSGAVGR